MKGTRDSIEVGILNKGLDEIYNVHSDLSFKKRKKKRQYMQQQKAIYKHINSIFL